MKPLEHAQNSARKYGGVYTDYSDIHEFLDMTKAAHPDVRHRAILHHSMGPYIAVQVFGEQRTNSDGRIYDIRQVCEDHIIEDLGLIPTVSYYLDLIPKEEMHRFAIRSKTTVYKRAVDD